MKMKNWIWLVIAVVVVFGGIFIFKSQNKKREDNVAKVIAILPLTGEYSQYGENDKKGILLALDELYNDSIKVEVVFVDNKGTAKDAVNALNQAISEKPIAIIDDAISSITESIIPISLKNKIPIISTGATNPAFSGISPYFFRIWNSDAEEGAFAANSCKGILNYNNINIVYLDNVYGNGLMTVFTKEFETGNYKIAEKLSIAEKSFNYKNIVNKINNVYPIYFIGYSNELGLFVKTLRQFKKNNQILATVAAEDKKIFEIAGNSAEGIIYVYNAEINNQTYTNFKLKYKEKYKENSQILTDVGYDAMMIIGNAIKQNVKTGVEMSDYLRNMPEIHGASGNIKFDKNGDVHKTMILKQIKNNSFGNF